MAKAWERIKALGPVAWVLSILQSVTTIQWPIVVSAVSAAGAAIWAAWEWATRWGYLPVALAALGTFLIVIWSLNGILWLRRQRRPTKASIAFDYGYGLTLDEVTPSHDSDNVENALEFRFQFRNVAPGPIKYHVERIDVIVDDRIQNIRNVDGILGRTSWTQLKIGGFRKAVVDTFPDRINGTYEFSILYGHPEDAYSRRMRKKINFELIKRDGAVTAAPWSILEEADEEVLNMPAATT